MEYENHSVPDHINVPREHPLKDFFVLVLGLGSLVVVIVLVLAFLAERLVVYIPFSVEETLAEHLFAGDNSFLQSNGHTDIENYLQSLTDKLAAAQELPQDMTLRVHYANDDMVNAFATLGGHIVVHRGLLEKMPNENALAMVLAHEVAHIKNRHPIIAMGRGITVSLALLSMLGLSDSSVCDQFISTIGSIASLSFSRENERQADADALQSLLAYYGHANGAEALFVVLEESQGGFDAPEFLSTHPLSELRIDEIKRFQNTHAAGAAATLTALPRNLLESIQ